MPGRRYSPRWLQLRTSNAALDLRSVASYWAITPHERLRIQCLIDGVIAELYGLDYADLTWILRDCSHSVSELNDNTFTRLLDPVAFWRVDKDKDPELRHTVLTLAAFHDLKRLITEHAGNREDGIKAFCSMNDGDGWQLPESLCLADLGLGHDECSNKRQPVREQLGPRFLPWQLEQSVEESWAECEMHARNILGEEGFARLQAELNGESPVKQSAPLSVAEAGECYGKQGDQGKLL